MKAIMKKLISAFCIVAVMLSVGIVSLSFNAGAYVNSTVKTWETVVAPLTMDGNKGVTGSQGGGSYSTDPWNGTHGAVYKLEMDSSPSLQVGKDNMASTENTDAYRLDAGATYKLTFDYMWGAGSAHVVSSGTSQLGIGLVWGSLLNGTDSSLSGVATRAKFANKITSVTLNSSNATLRTDSVTGKQVYTLNANTAWQTGVYQFTTSGGNWNKAYKYLLIQNESDNSTNLDSQGEVVCLNYGILYIDNIKIEKITSVSAANKMQSTWVNVVETINMENEAGVTGVQSTSGGAYVNDPNNEGHGKVYSYTAEHSSDSLQIGKDNNATVTDTDAFRMESNTTYKLSFDYMWGAGSTSAVVNGVYSHDVRLVWGTNLKGSGTRKVFGQNMVPAYVLDSSNSTVGTNTQGTSIRTQTVNSPWYHFEYTFTTSTDFKSDWTADLTSLMIQNDCNGDGNCATIYVDNITVDRAVQLTATESKAMYGDANLDGNVNSQDAIYLLYNTIYPTEYQIKAPCDYNRDDSVDSSDAVYLLYHSMFGAEQYPIVGRFTNGNIITPDVAYLDADGVAVYRVIYPSSDVLGATAQARSIASSLTGTIGQTVSAISDGNIDYNTFEILVGNTTRAESKQALEYLTNSNGGRIGDFVICTINNKIVINACDISGMARGCEYFINHYMKKAGVRGGINYIYTNDAGYSDGKINGVSISKFQIVSARFGTSYIVKNEINDLTVQISNKVGFTVKAYDDTVSESAYEIIVGETSKRSGSTQNYKADVYSISIKGKKVYLSGDSAHTVAMAVSEFSKMISEGSISNQDSMTGKYSDAVATYDTSEKYTLVWGDEFNYKIIGTNGIDNNNWRVYGPTDTNAIGAGYDGRNSVRGNTPDVIQVKDGKLQIRAKYDSDHYYGALITTENKMTFKYGYLEAKMRLPRGLGYWVAFWTDWNRNLKVNPYAVEVDVLEMNHKTAAEAEPNIHGWGKSEWPSQYSTSMQSTVTWKEKYSEWQFKQYKDGLIKDPTGASLHDNMHTYGFISTPEKVAFTFDGVEYLTIDMATCSQIFKDTIDCWQIIKVSQATCYGGYGKQQPDNDPDWTNGNNAFDVEYVHLYQLNDGIQKVHIGSGNPTN